MAELKKLIFAVEDDEGIQELYEGALESDYEVRVFSDAASFFGVFPKTKPDLVILDIMLPDMDGYGILSKIRGSDDKLPVIIVSAKGDELSLVKGLNKGADDYMSKPFSLMELIARIKTCLRRTIAAGVSLDGFNVDTNLYRVTYEGRDIGLKLKEFYLLRLLLSKAGTTITRDDILNEVWDTEFMGETRTLDIHIASLREKIKAAGGGERIVTVRGVGYRFE